MLDQRKRLSLREGGCGDTLYIVTVTSSASFLFELQQLEDELLMPFLQNFICVWISVWLLLSFVCLLVSCNVCQRLPLQDSKNSSRWNYANIVDLWDHHTPNLKWNWKHRAAPGVEFSPYSDRCIMTLNKLPQMETQNQGGHTVGTDIWLVTVSSKCSSHRRSL